jgi:hypothetical protein
MNDTFNILNIPSNEFFESLGYYEADEDENEEQLEIDYYALDKVLPSELTEDEVRIAKIQSKIFSIGYAWVEQKFMDDKPDEIVLYLTDDEKAEMPGYEDNVFVWGRYKRLYAWECALDFIIKMEAGEKNNIIK